MDEKRWEVVLTVVVNAGEARRLGDGCRQFSGDRRRQRYG
jgi:hypothetical protein